MNIILFVWLGSEKGVGRKKNIDHKILLPYKNFNLSKVFRQFLKKKGEVAVKVF